MFEKIHQVLGPAFQITFDGERVDESVLNPTMLQKMGIMVGAAGNLPDIIMEVVAQHMERYDWATHALLPGSKVLDVATGYGYGAQMLTQAGMNVVGVEIDPQATHKAKNAHPNAADFVTADGAYLPLADNSFDGVTSFETIEHTSQYDQFLDEIVRVLRPDGTLIMSTPNRLFSSPGKAFDEKPNNPYHTQEFDQTFFLNLLGDRFETVELYGQDWKEIPENNTDTRSTLMNKMKLPILKAKFHAQNLIIYEKRAEVTKAAKDGQQPVYFVAICKNPRK